MSFTSSEAAEAVELHLESWRRQLLRLRLRHRSFLSWVAPILRGLAPRVAALVDTSLRLANFGWRRNPAAT